MIRRLIIVAAATGASALLAPAAPRSAPTRLSMAFNNEVKTVSQTIAAFETNYPRPVATLWRSPINDMLQTTHLSCVNQDFKYDPLFGFGFLTLMDLIMATYPVPDQGDKITDALISALDFDPAQVRSDSAAIKADIEGKTEADLLGAASSGAGAVGEAAKVVQSRDTYFHTRPGSVGLLAIMDSVSVQTDKAGIARWAAPFGYRERPLDNMSGLLKEYREKIANAMQMMKAMEIREKKRMAEQLEEKAKAAQAKAEGAAAAADAKSD